MKNIINVLATGGTHLGDLCFWALSDASISRADLEQKWAATGLAKKLLPEPPTSAKSFKLAVRETQVGLADKLIRPLVDDEASVIFAVVHEKKCDAGYLEYTQEAKVALELLTGAVGSDNPTHELVAAIKTRFTALRDTHTSDDVRRTITRTLQDFSAVLLRENGGVWWVPAPYADALRKVQACIEGIGASKMYLLPVHDSADAHRTLGDAATKSLEAELLHLKTEVEASHLERADMQRMLAQARRPDGSPFRAVLVDDLSRLSRDMGGTWQIVFGDLATSDVRVIDITTGMSSDGAGARLTFGAMALVNDTFLQLVRTETHRGLEGRAISGHWTGGRVYGYRTVKEPNPPDPEHPRSIPLIDELEAATVRRIFTLYAEGTGHKRIAGILNAEGLRAPYDVEYGKRAGKGWGHSTIRAMLRNERYLGKWVWNKRKWVPVPGKKAKRALRRPPSEWVTNELPQLAIVTQELWDRVRERQVTRKARSKGRAHGEATSTPYLLSGLLRCGTCGSAMSIVSRQIKNGRRYPTFGCSANRSKGEAICANRMTVSEAKVTSRVFAAIRGLLDDPALADVFVAGFRERLGEEATKSVSHVEPEIAELEKRANNLGDAISVAGWSMTLGAQLKAVEERLAQLREVAKTQTSTAAPPVEVPDADQLRRYFNELALLLDAARTTGTGNPKAWLGEVRLTPCEQDGRVFYKANGLIKLDPTILSNGRAEFPSRGCCGGRI